MTWTNVVAKAAQKQLRRIPARDRDKVTAAIQAMAADPFWGDVMKLEGDENRYRRRVGSFRIFFRIDRANRTAGSDCPADINDLLIARLSSESSLASSVSPIFQRVDERRVLRLVSRNSRRLMQNVA